MKQEGRIIRRMGFIRDQEGIMNRYLRERSNWDRHLQHTRSFIEFYRHVFGNLIRRDHYATGMDTRIAYGAF